MTSYSVLRILKRYSETKELRFDFFNHTENILEMDKKENNKGFEIKGNDGVYYDNEGNTLYGDGIGEEVTSEREEDEEEE